MDLEFRKEEFRKDIEKWLKENHFCRLPSWVIKDDFFKDMVDKVMKAIEKTPRNETDIKIPMNVLYPLITDFPSGSFVYIIPSEYFEYVNTLRPTYTVKYLDIN